jgi:hypothetical protein
MDTSSWTGEVPADIGGRFWTKTGLMSPFLIPYRFSRRAVCGVDMKGEELLLWVVCSLGLTGAAERFALMLSRPAVPDQVAPFNVFALDSLIHCSTSVTLVCDSLSWTLLHPELQV